MRFGSLTDFSVIKSNQSEIGRQLLIPRPTVVNMLKRFAQRQYRLENVSRAKIRFACIPQQVQR